MIRLLGMKNIICFWDAALFVMHDMWGLILVVPGHGKLLYCVIYCNISICF